MPSADRWDQIERLFESARTRSEAERPAFLREAARDEHGAVDEALVAEVLDLLAHAAEADADWGESAADFARPLLDAGDLAPGDRVGPYEIEREIGRGGMGTVYAARRTDDLHLRVALKVVRLGLDTADVRERFRQEHRVLAALDHPGIARLLDGGVTPDGRPFFAMELVEGEPLDVYCDRHQLSVPDRLALFAQVCEAVHYAHQRLVVHRDLKPSNVLVEGWRDEKGIRNEGTSHPSSSSFPLPSSPRVKLLDFGIAKVLDPDGLGLSHLLTRAGSRVLTPAYASPELLRGEAATTASDVFGLGALLYALLAGRPPRSARLVAEPTEPVRPSDAIAESATLTRADGTTETVSPETVSAARGLAPDALRRRLAGDLDTIVGMAMRPEPERRYDSAAALAADLRRHLAGEPVSARPDSWGYRARLFARRHRAGVALAALALVLLTGFGGAMAVERARTAREAQKARAVADVLAGLFAATNPTVADGDTLTVVEFLAHSEGRLRDDLARQPDVLAEVLVTIGMAYRDMTAFDRAAPALYDALALRRRHGSREEVAATLGEIETMQYMADSLDAALRTSAAWLALLHEAHGPRSLDLVSPLRAMARAHLQAHQLDAARRALDEARAITRLHHATDPEAHLSVMGLEGWYAAETGDHEASVRVAREILTLHARTGASESDVALTERILGSELYQTGRFEEAERVLRSSLTRYQQVYGPESRYTALVLGHLAETAAADGRNTEADRLFAQALPLKVRYFGADGSEVGTTLLRWGHHARLTGNLVLADSLLARAEVVWADTRGPDDPNGARARVERALVRVARGTAVAARDVEAEWARVAADPPSRERAVIQLLLADLRQLEGRASEADRLRRDATPLLRVSPFRREVEAQRRGADTG